MKLSTLIGWALAGGCGLLLLFALALGTGAFTDIDGAVLSDGVPERPLPDAGGAGEFELRPLEEYAEIAQRPLFNEDRRPAPPDETIVDGDNLGDTPEVPTIPLDVSVNGIIITPDVRLAIITDNRTKETLRLREGMPLEGEMANWTLTGIEPRKLTFDGDSMGNAEVELQVHTQALAGGPPVQVRRPSPAAEEGAEAAEGEGEQAEAQSPVDAEARAEEIRRRVAERRAQLREEAERRRQQQAEEQ